jgi:hypothetical protein
MKDYESPAARTKRTFATTGEAWYAAVMMWFTEGDGHQCHWHGALSPAKRRSLVYNFLTGETTTEYR